MILVTAWVALSVAGVDLGRWTSDGYSALFAFGIVATTIPSHVVPRPLLLALIGAMAFVARGPTENSRLPTPLVDCRAWPMAARPLA